MSETKIADRWKNITVGLHGCCSYDESWELDKPVPEGWGNAEDARSNACVSMDDWDALLEYVGQLQDALKDFSRQDCEVGLQRMREKYGYLLAEDL